LPNPPAFDASVGGPRRNVAIRLGVEKLEWCGYPMLKKIEDKFIRVDRIHERDRRTDGQRDGVTDIARRHRPRLCTASVGKNKIALIILSIFI